MSHEVWANLQTLLIHVAGTIIASSLTDSSVQLLKPGSFTWVSNALQGTWRPEICVGKYYFFSRSRWKLASLWSREVIHFNFIIMVNFKSSGFDKGTGGKSGKFQFDCDGCILFTRRNINITIHFPFPQTICLFILFFAAELSCTLQRLSLLYR